MDQRTPIPTKNRNSYKPGLTEHQHTIIRRLIEGYRQGEIAELLGVHVNTLSKSINQIIANLGVQTTAQAVAVYSYHLSEVEAEALGLATPRLKGGGAAYHVSPKVTAPQRSVADAWDGETVSPLEAAEMLGVSYPYVFHLINNGRLVARQGRDRRWQITVSSVQAQSARKAG